MPNKQNYDFQPRNSPLPGSLTPRRERNQATRPLTPSRIQQRVSTSPLRVPLEKAIEKCVQNNQNDRSLSVSRRSNLDPARSRRRL